MNNVVLTKGADVVRTQTTRLMPRLSGQWRINGVKPLALEMCRIIM